MIKENNKNKNLHYASEMTYKQTLALYHKFINSDIENEILNLKYFNEKLNKFNENRLPEIRKWLFNSWNTEMILNSNISIIEKSGQSFALQWSFPQAYYSVFGSILAHFISHGYTERSHLKVIRKFNSLITANNYPKSISFYANGIDKNTKYTNLTKIKGYKSTELNINDKNSIYNQICQLLKSTRKINLEKGKSDKKLKTKKGKKKKRLNTSEWLEISNMIGPTTILDFLYRKRIKANYKNIDVFIYEKINGKDILMHLCEIVSKINFINEMYVGKEIGEKNLKLIKDEFFSKSNNQKIDKRLNRVIELIASR